MQTVTLPKGLPQRTDCCVWAWPAETCAVTRADLAPLHSALPAARRATALLLLQALADEDPQFLASLDKQPVPVCLGVPARPPAQIAADCGLTRRQCDRALALIASLGALDLSLTPNGTKRARIVLRYDRLLGLQPYAIAGRSGEPADLASPAAPWSWGRASRHDLDLADPVESALADLLAVLADCGLPCRHDGWGSVESLRKLALAHGGGNLAVGLAKVAEVAEVIPQVARRFPASSGVRTLLTPQGFELLEQQWREYHGGGGAWQALPSY